MKKTDSKNQIDFKARATIIATMLARHGNGLSYGISALMILVTIIFLAHNFVGTLFDLAALKTLKSQVSPVVVDMKKWSEVKTALEWKKQPLDATALQRNPFE